MQNSQPNTKKKIHEMFLESRQSNLSSILTTCINHDACEALLTLLAELRLVHLDAAAAFQVDNAQLR